MQLRVAGEAGAGAPAGCCGGCSAEHGSHGQVMPAVVKQRAPVQILGRGNGAVRQVQRMALKGIGVQRHRLVVRHGKPPDELQLFRSKRRTGGRADAAILERPLAREAGIECDLGIRRDQHGGAARALPDLGRPVGEGQREPRHIGAEQQAGIGARSRESRLQNVALALRPRAGRQEKRGAKEAACHGFEPRRSISFLSNINFPSSP